MLIIDQGEACVHLRPGRGCLIVIVHREDAGVSLRKGCSLNPGKGCTVRIMSSLFITIGSDSSKSSS